MNPRQVVAMLLVLVLATVLVFLPRSAHGEPGTPPAEAIVLPPAVVKQCQEQGGCTVFSRARFVEIMVAAQKQAYEAGVAAGRAAAEKSCVAKTI